MKQKIAITLSCLLIILVFSCSSNNSTTSSVVSIIPKLQNLKVTNGKFVINNKLQIVTEWVTEDIKNAVEQFGSSLRMSVGVDVQLVEKDNSNREIPSIFIEKIEDKNIGNEGYNLLVTKENIIIKANRANGVFYAFQTILQLLPSQVFSEVKMPSSDLTIQCVEITDKPRFKWRGLLFDVSRYFFPKEYIKRQIDYLAMHKMNVYHLHLTDDQGWRIEIKKYPKLTEVGAWRKDDIKKQPWMDSLKHLKKANKVVNYGGYYTQEDIKEIVEYAKENFVTIIPEIEMPGHCIAALAAYPELSCTGEHYDVPAGGIGHDNRKAYCAGNEQVYTFLENVLTEVMELFPSEYIHIGGDEVNFASWENCPKCQLKIKSENLKNEKELQSSFIKRIAKFVDSKGKKIIGWDEIMYGGLPSNATVTAWRENNFGILAARENHDVIYTPDSHFYLNEYQGNPQFEPLAYNQITPLRRVYSFEPIDKDSLTVEQSKHILGVEAALWSNFNSTISNSDYLLFPRLAAVAEVAWTDKALRNWDDFTIRLQNQLKRYDYAKIGYAKTLYDVTAEYELNKKQKTLMVTLTNEAGSTTQIRYTLDGSKPKPTSSLYSKPFDINKVTFLKAATFRENKMISRRITEIKILASKATGIPLKVESPYDERYSANGEYALTDGIQGSSSYANGEWQGYFGVDFIGTLDLLKEQNISKVTACFLHATNAGIFFPESVEVFISVDGVNYNSVGDVKNDISNRETKIIRKGFAISFPQVKARFVKIVARNIGECPTWHKYANAKAFIFVDEITVE